jgi:hypothetical protein
MVLNFLRKVLREENRCVVERVSDAQELMFSHETRVVEVTGEFSNFTVQRSHTILEEAEPQYISKLMVLSNLLSKLRPTINNKTPS